MDRLKGSTAQHLAGVVGLQSSTSWKSQRISLFLVIVFLFADLGVLANEADSSPLELDTQSLYSEPILVDGLPPLMCGDEQCLRAFCDNIIALIPNQQI